MQEGVDVRAEPESPLQWKSKIDDEMATKSPFKRALAQLEALYELEIGMLRKEISRLTIGLEPDIINQVVHCDEPPPELGNVKTLPSLDPMGRADLSLDSVVGDTKSDQNARPVAAKPDHWKTLKVGNQDAWCPILPGGCDTLSDTAPEEMTKERSGKDRKVAFGNNTEAYFSPHRNEKNYTQDQTEQGSSLMATDSMTRSIQIPKKMPTRSVDAESECGSACSGGGSFFQVIKQTMKIGSRAGSPDGETDDELGNGLNLSSAPSRPNVRRFSVRDQAAFHLAQITSAQARTTVLDLAPCWTDMSNLYKQSGTTVAGRIKKKRTIATSGEFIDEYQANRFLQMIWYIMQILTINPTSGKRLVWDVFGVACLMYDIIFLPLTLAFEFTEETWMLALAKSTSIYWTCDIFANFLCGFQTSSCIEMRPHVIASNYVRTWFIMDLVLVCGDWFLFFYLSDNATFLRFGKFITRLMRAFRMLRLVKLHRILTDFMDRIPSEVVRTLVGVLKLLVSIILLNHYIACGWHWLGGVSGPTWLNPKFKDESLLYRYLTSLHWSFTQFTPASMDVFATTTIERFYSVLVLIFALVTFSSFVSIITSSITQLQQFHSRKLQNQVVLRRYLSERSIPAPLVLRVCYFVQNYQKQVGGLERTRTREDKVEALKMLPTSIIEEIKYEAYHPTFLVHPALSLMAQVTERLLREICGRAVMEVSLAVGQELFSSCKTAQHMIFVTEGALSYAFPEAPSIEKRSSVAMSELIVEKDCWACEAVLWAKKLDIFGPFIAVNWCDTYLVNPEDFRTICPHYPEAFVGLACYGERYIDRTNEDASGDKANRWKISICPNDPMNLCRDLANTAFGSDIATKKDNGTLLPNTPYVRSNSLGRLRHNFKRSRSAGAAYGNSFRQEVLSRLASNTTNWSNSSN